MSRLWEIRENYGERSKGNYSDAEMDAYECGYEEGYAAAMKEVKGGYGERGYEMRGGYGQRDDMAGAGGGYMGNRDDRYYGERHRDSMGRFRR